MTLLLRKELADWKELNGYENLSLTHSASLKLEQALKHHSFYDYIESSGKMYPVWARKHIEHPLPYLDEGTRLVDCTTNLTNYDNKHIANLLIKVNSHCTNSFMQQIRRSISILERPLVTSRGDGKSYIYSNINPKYAQYIVAILRTYYNFCTDIKGLDGKYETPAQKLGIAEKKYVIKDILYFK